MAKPSAEARDHEEQQGGRVSKPGRFLFPRERGKGQTTPLPGPLEAREHTSAHTAECARARRARRGSRHEERTERVIQTKVVERAAAASAQHTHSGGRRRQGQNREAMRTNRLHNLESGRGAETKRDAERKGAGTKGGHAGMTKFGAQSISKLHGISKRHANGLRLFGERAINDPRFGPNRRRRCAPIL